MGENIFTGIAAGLRTYLAGAGVPPLASEFIVMVVKLLAVIIFVSLNVVWLVYMERKVAAYIQCRIGPNRVGPKGLLQTVADVVKLLAKEIIIPRRVDKIVYLAAPVLVFVPPMMAFAVIPWGEGMAPIDLNIGVFYVLAVASLSTIIFWMGGWSSNNKYSLVGGMRVVAQMVSYELPLVLSLLGVIMLTGTLSITEIVNAQRGTWFIFAQPLAFLIYFIAGVSEVNRTPFDLVEGESEIIAGPYTEYSGMGYAMYMLAEYGSMMVISCMCTIMFLGGWLAPFGWTFLPSWFWFFIKVYAMIFIFMWIRWTYPRIRVDQLMGFGWKVLVPLSLANIFVTGVGMYIYRAIGW
ncbi:NADH-quinone oxidoreductase subunit NuoH [Desulfofundulus thermosubterraneus]|uniref:NADH-quinone oxidoreductase subunit H n=1 Tax=Desulfofundulus thermosubterraneus DSM 16057 TaxID=1121432 RepID=A0A1M6KVM0_9FIRM|nr:NADH-quinone oxidoreductase subunit NuoH [Desulfofundulus thermosubterraneus]SHJ63027.1 NADH dehydrogenase subunit H [Desulfofundulus thermosubterraneus DSM 16057]